jgi:diguanylate cyclase (GGDEF)-like protein
LINVAVCVFVARGMRMFVRRPPLDRASWLVASLATAVILGANLWEAPRVWTVVAACLATGTLLVRAAEDVRAGLADEFGRGAAFACSLPLWLIGTLLLARAATSLAGVDGSTQPLQTGGVQQVALSLVLVLMAMALHLAMGAMLMLRMIGKLRHLSQHDALTGLLNRRAFGLRLRAERERQHRQPAPLALLALDLDHFKAVNDRWGHAAGDAVLAAAADVLRREARTVDVVARMGGEEFAVLLPGTDLEGADRLAERMLDAFRRMTVAYEGTTLQVTASIGAAVSTGAAEDDEELFRRADRALYLAKAGGRDRVVCAGALSAVDAGDRPRHRAA